MRKKILLTAIIAICMLQLSAQLEKGKLYGDLTIGRRIAQYNATMANPSLALALSKHSSFGISYSYTRSDLYVNAFSPNMNREYWTKQGFGLEYNYLSYFRNSSKWGWFLNGSLDYSWTKVKDKTGGSGTIIYNNFHQTELMITPGIFFRPSDKIFFHFDVGGSVIGHARGFTALKSNFLTQVNLGITFRFGKKKNK